MPQITIPKPGQPFLINVPNTFIDRVWWRFLQALTSFTGITVTDGSTSVSPASTITFSGATVTDGGSGNAEVAIAGYAKLYNNGGGDTGTELIDGSGNVLLQTGLEGYLKLPRISGGPPFFILNTTDLTWESATGSSAIIVNDTHVDLQGGANIFVGCSNNANITGTASSLTLTGGTGGGTNAQIALSSGTLTLSAAAMTLSASSTLTFPTSLPSSDPHVNGQVWQSGGSPGTSGTLMVSNG